MKKNLIYCVDSKLYEKTFALFEIRKGIEQTVEREQDIGRKIMLSVKVVIRRIIP